MNGRAALLALVLVACGGAPVAVRPVADPAAVAAERIAKARAEAAAQALRQRDAKGRQRPEVLYGRRKMTAWLAR